MKQRPCAIIFMAALAGSFFGFFIQAESFFFFSAAIISFFLVLFITLKTFRILLFLSFCFFITLLGAQFYKNYHEQKILSIEEKINTYEGIITNIKLKNDASKIASFKIYWPKRLNVLLILKDQASLVKIKNGDVIVLKGQIKKFELAESDVHFDGKKYSLSKNLHGTIVVKNDLFITKTQKNYSSFFAELRASLTEFLLKNLTPYEASIIMALMIGDTALFDDFQKQVFSSIGAQHILAVSGLQVSLIAYILFALFSFLLACTLSFRHLHLVKPIASGFSLIFIWAFIALCDYPDSAVRAGIMSSVMLLSVFAMRRVDIFDAFYLSGTITLFFAPWSVLDLGFLLSYAAVFGLILCAIFSKEIVKKITNFSITLSYATQLLLSSTAAYLATLPIIAAYIGQTSSFSILSNLFLIPIASVCQTVAIVFGFFAALIKSEVLIKAASSFANIIEIFADFLSESFSNTFYIPQGFSIYFCIAFSFLFFGFIFSFAYKKRAFLCTFLFCIFLLPAYLPHKEKLIISSIPVGQGDCTYIKMPNNKNIIIDAAGHMEQKYDAGKNIIVPLLKRKQVSVVDILIITHPDLDHILGSFALIDKIKVNEIWISSKEIQNENLKLLLGKALEKNIPVRTIKNILGEHYFGKAKLSVLAPNTHNEQEYYKELKANDNSIVVKIDYLEKSALFAGDIERYGEKLLLADNYNLKADILKSPHHGSKTSSSEDFVKAVNPKIVLFSTGKNNRFGFPHKEIVERYEKINARCFNTAEDGEIIIEIGEDYFNVSSYQKKYSS